MPVLILGTALGIYRLTFVSSHDDPPAYPSQPNPVKALYDEPLVSDQQLYDVLRKVRPPKGPAVSNNWLHAWRLWGSNATFADPEIPSGETMQDFFINDDVYRKYSPPGTPPLMMRTGQGLAVRSFDDNYQHRTTSSYHTDDILATFAESGLPLDTRLKLRDGEATIRELVESSMKSFHLQRHEFEWSVISFARYGYPTTQWRNRYGQKVDFGRLVNELTKHRLGLGPCNGIHRMEALVVLFQSDQLHAAEKNQLSRHARQSLVKQMKRVSVLLARSQSAEGFWTRRWPLGEAAKKDLTVPLADKILVTGHHLEWLALAPKEIHPPREQLARAAQWLAEAMLQIDDKQLAARYGPLSHAARALCLWGGDEAFPTWQRLQAARSE